MTEEGKDQSLRRKARGEEGDGKGRGLAVTEVSTPYDRRRRRPADEAESAGRVSAGVDGSEPVWMAKASSNGSLHTAPHPTSGGLWGEPALQRLPPRLPLHRGRDESPPTYGGSFNSPYISNHTIFSRY